MFGCKQGIQDENWTWGTLKTECMSYKFAPKIIHVLATLIIMLRSSLLLTPYADIAGILLTEEINCIYFYVKQA